jgi:hypothetical protein
MTYLPLHRSKSLEAKQRTTPSPPSVSPHDVTRDLAGAATHPRISLPQRFATPAPKLLAAPVSRRSLAGAAPRPRISLPQHLSPGSRRSSFWSSTSPQELAAPAPHPRISLEFRPEQHPTPGSRFPSCSLSQHLGPGPGQNSGRRSTSPRNSPLQRPTPKLQQ